MHRKRQIRQQGRWFMKGESKVIRNGTDNANDALKETAKTWEKHQNNLRKKNRPEMTVENGVEKKIIGVCDRFHIFQLEIKHMSEKCCGKSQ